MLALKAASSVGDGKAPWITVTGVGSAARGKKTVDILTEGGEGRRGRKLRAFVH